MARHSYQRIKKHKRSYKKALLYLINMEELKKEEKIFHLNKESYDSPF